MLSKERTVSMKWRQRASLRQWVSTVCATLRSLSLRFLELDSIETETEIENEIEMGMDWIGMTKVVLVVGSINVTN